MSERLSDYLTPRQLADEFGLVAGTLANLRYKGGGPVFVRAGRRILYKRSDVIAWLDSNRFERTDVRAKAGA